MVRWRRPAAGRPWAAARWRLPIWWLCVALTCALFGAARAEEPAETGAQHLAKYAPPTVRIVLPCATPAELDKLDALEVAWNKAFDAAVTAYDVIDPADAAWGAAERDLRAAEAAEKRAFDEETDASLKIVGATSPDKRGIRRQFRASFPMGQ